MISRPTYLKSGRYAAARAEASGQTATKPRVAFYSHDSFGLGHLRRSLLLAESLTQHGYEVEPLLVTGSPRAHFFPRSRNIEVVKLPAVTKDSQGHYVSRNSSRPLSETLRERKAQMREALFAFRPDALVVDHVPAGLEGELLPLLADLRRAFGTKLIAGLRDILDAPDRVRNNWSQFGIHRILQRVYDEVWIYGCRDVFALDELYELPSELRPRLRYLGYLGRPQSSVPHFPRSALVPDAGASENSRQELVAERTSRPRVLCVVGGGGDGFPVASAFLEAIANDDTLDATVVTGPFLAQRERRQLGRIAERAPHAHVIHFTACLDQRIAESDLVVTMGGYNSLMECLSYGRRTLVVPRVFPREEQWLRSRAFADRGLVSIADPRELDPGRLLQQVQSMLKLPVPPSPEEAGVSFDGLENFAKAMGDTLGIAPQAPRRNATESRAPSRQR